MANRQQYGAVYSTINDVLRQHYIKGERPGFRSVQSLIEDLKTAGNNAYRQDHEFPTRFYQGMSLSAIRWFIEGFSGTTAPTDITDTLQTVWKYHRNYVDGPIDWDKAVAEACTIANGHPRHTEHMVLVAMEEIERHEEEGRTNDDDSNQ